MFNWVWITYLKSKRVIFNGFSTTTSQNFIIVVSILIYMSLKLFSLQFNLTALFYKTLEIANNKTFQEIIIYCLNMFHILPIFLSVLRKQLSIVWACGKLQPCLRVDFKHINTSCGYGYLSFLIHSNMFSGCVCFLSNPWN